MAANCFTWSTKDAKLVDKEIDEDFKFWLKQEEDYDEDSGYRRSFLELQDEYFKYVAPGRRAAIEQRVRAKSMQLMERGWEYQFMIQQAKANVMERLGIEAATKTYFITIRPNKHVAFADFYAKVVKLVRRSCVIDYSLSFEQKGESEETLGQGFHVHIVAHMKQRSKGEVLRDVQSSFKTMAADNCVQVDLAPRPKELVQNYLLDYKSDDGHKEQTKQWDAQWRDNMGLLPLYTNKDVMPSTHNPPIKSNRRVVFFVEEPEA